jgi:Anaphase-promoting complex, cyclosome, subunit 3
MDDQPTNRRGADAVRSRDRRSPAADDLFADTEPSPPSLPPIEKRDRDYWEGAIRAALAERSHRSMLLAEQALSACPGDPDLLLLAALTALANADPERAHRLLKRFRKRWVPGKDADLLTALALGQQKQYAKAQAVLRENRLDRRWCT